MRMFYVHSFYYDCAHLLACITLTGMVASYQGQPSISRGFIHHDLTFFCTCAIKRVCFILLNGA